MLISSDLITKSAYVGLDTLSFSLVDLRVVYSVVALKWLTILTLFFLEEILFVELEHSHN